MTLEVSAASLAPSLREKAHGTFVGEYSLASRFEYAPIGVNPCLEERRGGCDKTTWATRGARMLTWERDLASRRPNGQPITF
jgi:hypothetical protein